MCTARSVQREPPQTCAWSGGDFNLAGSHAWRAEVPPPLGSLKWGGLQLYRHSCLQGWSPPTSSTSLGGFTLGWPSCMYIVQDCMRCAMMSIAADAGTELHPNIKQVKNMVLTVLCAVYLLLWVHELSLNAPLLLLVSSKRFWEVHGTARPATNLLTPPTLTIATKTSTQTCFSCHGT